MVFDKLTNVLSWKEELGKTEAGLLSMYGMYSMTDTFIGKSYMVGAGISQTNNI